MNTNDFKPHEIDFLVTAVSYWCDQAVDGKTAQYIELQRRLLESLTVQTVEVEDNEGRVVLVENDNESVYGDEWRERYDVVEALDNRTIDEVFVKLLNAAHKN